MVQIEIVYATAQHQKLYILTVPENTTVRAAIHLCSVQQDFPDADLNMPLGIFGKVVKDDTILQAGDRVEIYRPLLADPKEARRKRASKHK